MALPRKIRDCPAWAGRLSDGFLEHLPKHLEAIPIGTVCRLSLQHLVVGAPLHLDRPGVRDLFAGREDKGWAARHLQDLPGVMAVRFHLLPEPPAVPVLEETLDVEPHLSRDLLELKAHADRPVSLEECVAHLPGKPPDRFIALLRGGLLGLKGRKKCGHVPPRRSLPWPDGQIRLLLQHERNLHVHHRLGCGAPVLQLDRQGAKGDAHPPLVLWPDLL